MSKGLRLTEKWMQRGLWLVAIVFASFLIGLGNRVVANLWSVEPALEVEQFIAPAALQSAKAARDRATQATEAASEALEQARQAHEVANSNARLARDTFDNWTQTRVASGRPDQDPELIARTRALDTVQQQARAALAKVEAQEQAALDARQAGAAAEKRWDALHEPAYDALARAETRRELRVFLYRLALTLPLLVVAGWLYVHKRKGQYWPFVWGFIFFAGFAFFVELVPYLPSYGGYVRNIVGIVLTFLIGRHAIIALQRYLARQKSEEALPDDKRRQTLRYDTAFTRLSKSVCPGCERSVDLKDPSVDFCPHCGIGLYDHCLQCKTRKASFARFCFSCGTPGQAGLPE